MNPQLSTLYEALQELMPPTSFDPLQEVVDLIANTDCLIDADARGFTLQAGESTHRVDLPGGLTEAHYHRLAPSLVHDDKAILALAVIKRAIQPKTWLEWENAKTLARDLHRTAGDDDYQGMLRAIDSVGFAAVIADMQERIAKVPKSLRCRARLVFVEQPAWDDGGVLSFGNKMWKFRKQLGGPVVHLLAAFEQKGWPHSLIPTDLDAAQVVEAARVLREKTAPIIKWSASNDGYISWWLL